MIVVLILAVVLLLQLLRNSELKNEKLILALQDIERLHGELHCSDWITIEIKETIEEALYERPRN